MSEKITLFIAAWILLMLIIAEDANLDIFFILIFIGFLIANELTYHFAVNYLKKRMDIFVIFFLGIFLIIALIRIINSLDILNI